MDLREANKIAQTIRACPECGHKEYFVGTSFIGGEVEVTGIECKACRADIVKVYQDQQKKR